MGVRRTVFWGGQTIFWTGQKAISTLLVHKYVFKLAIVYLKFQIPGPGKCLVLPIGGDTHSFPYCRLKIWLLKLTYLSLTMLAIIALFWYQNFGPGFVFKHVSKT